MWIAFGNGSPSSCSHIIAPLISPRVSRTLSVSLRLALFALAAWALKRELAGVRRTELVRQIAIDGWRRGALALACTAASFFLLGIIEWLALRSSRLPVRVPRRFAFITAFVANATSQSVGLSLLTGAAVRLRAYARYRLDAADVARVSAFVTATVTLGLLACAAVAFEVNARPLALAGFAVPGSSLALALGGVVVAYLAWSVLATGETVGRGRWQLRRPSGRIALAQLGVSSADWLLTGTVLFAVLPPSAGIGYGELLRVYLIAQALGVASHIPGGVGVFEVVVLAVAIGGDESRRPALVAGLVLFRVVYYLVPLFAAVVVGLIAELLPRRRGSAHRLGVRSDDSMVMRVG
jgi:uncharacterized membrane protein YbhN (UPF0104 family)